MATGTSPHHPLRGGAGEPLSHRASNDSGWHDSGIGGPSYGHIPPQPVVLYHSSGSKSRSSIGSLRSVPGGPEEGDGMGEGGCAAGCAGEESAEAVIRGLGGAGGWGLEGRGGGGVLVVVLLAEC